MDVKMLDQQSKAVGTGSSLEFETILIQFWGIQPWNVPDGFLNWTSNTELWSSWSPGMMGKVSGFDGMAAEEGEKGVNPFPWHHGCTVRMWRPGLPGSVKFPFNLGQDQLAPQKWWSCIFQPPNICKSRPPLIPELSLTSSTGIPAASTVEME